MSQIFEIVQAMSGQKNSVVIPGPYLDFFSGDQQVFALSAVLNQLVFWSGKSSLDDGWFYKSHEDLAKELRGLSEDQVQRIIKKLSRKYLPGVIEATTRKVNGTPTSHYRIDGDALISKIFPLLLDSAEVRNGKREVAESTPQKCGMENAEVREQSRRSAESYLYTDHYTDHYIQNKDLTSENSGESSDASPKPDVSKAQPDVVVSSPKGNKWGSEEDLLCAKWIWGRIIRLYEKAAETDGELVRPKEPNWTNWANDIRLMCSLDKRSHRQICELFNRANRDSFWCKNILSPAKLREKWDELVLKLPAATTEASTRRVTPPTGQTPPGFMSAAEFVAQHPIPDGAFDDDD